MSAQTKLSFCKILNATALLMPEKQRSKHIDKQDALRNKIAKN